MNTREPPCILIRPHSVRRSEQRRALVSYCFSSPSFSDVVVQFYISRTRLCFRTWSKNYRNEDTFIHPTPNPNAAHTAEVRDLHESMISSSSGAMNRVKRTQL